MVDIIICEHCGSRFDPDDVCITKHNAPDADRLCWDCLIDTCTECGDIPPGGIDPVMQMCEMCMEEFFPYDEDEGQ